MFPKNPIPRRPFEPQAVALRALLTSPIIPRALTFRRHCHVYRSNVAPQLELLSAGYNVGLACMVILVWPSNLTVLMDTYAT